MLNDNTYDFIVIGAGTAGGVIAKKLSDDKITSVLVLEPGTNMVPELSSPSGAVSGVLSADNRHSFNIFTNVQPAIGNQQLRVSGGRAIGGSSEHNAMYAVRGSKELYDEWARLVGPQWSYNSLKSLFKKNETYTGKTQQPEERGKKGPIFIRQQIIPKDGITVTLAKATSEILDIPIVEDYNTGIRDCTFFKSQFLNKEVNGKFVRSSTATGYLNSKIVTQGNEFHPDEIGVGGRELVILVKTTVNKILFKQGGKIQVAVGVDFVRNGKSNKAFAKKGIILCAGNLSSVILQRSGIGDPDDLKRAGIETLIYSPNVGHNFQTQFTTGLGVEVKTDRILELMAADPDNPITLGAFNADRGKGGRRLQIIGSPAPSFLPASEVLENNWDFDPKKKSNIISFGLFDDNPKSRGTIMVSHSDPEAYPSIDLNPLGDADDLNFMVDQFIETHNIMKKAREIDPEGIFKVVFPPEIIFEIKNIEEKRKKLESYVRASYRNVFHFGGQCKMARSVREGVVDGELNVFGTKNLKVADLSVAPILPDGNTSLPSQIIGLNAVRFIQD
ncbi:choline dehydrogenase [Bacillus sp. UNCCL81]|nr:choline dehydrogenase [Bacillus sp. UNCCL81]